MVNATNPHAWPPTQPRPMRLELVVVAVPSITNFDTPTWSAAVSTEAVVIGVVATIMHVEPRHIQQKVVASTMPVTAATNSALTTLVAGPGPLKWYCRRPFFLSLLPGKGQRLFIGNTHNLRALSQPPAVITKRQHRLPHHHPRVIPSVIANIWRRFDTAESGHKARRSRALSGTGQCGVTSLMASRPRRPPVSALGSSDPEAHQLRVRNRADFSLHQHLISRPRLVPVARRAGEGHDVESRHVPGAARRVRPVARRAV